MTKEEFNCLKHLTHFDWHIELEALSTRNASRTLLIQHNTYTADTSNCFVTSFSLINAHYTSRTTVSWALCLSYDVPQHTDTKTAFLLFHYFLSYVTTGLHRCWFVASSTSDRCLPLGLLSKNTCALLGRTFVHNNCWYRDGFWPPPLRDTCLKQRGLTTPVGDSGW